MQATSGLGWVEWYSKLVSVSRGRQSLEKSLKMALMVFILAITNVWRSLPTYYTDIASHSCRRPYKHGFGSAGAAWQTGNRHARHCNGRRVYFLPWYEGASGVIGGTKSPSAMSCGLYGVALTCTVGGISEGPRFRLSANHRNRR